MSPMGEPFFGRTAGEDGLVVWFQQADRNHDGAITADEMVADAARFFQVLDTNHDGEIDPDEIAHYENVIAPEVRTHRIMQADLAAETGQQGAQGGSGGSGGGGGYGGHGGGGYGGGGYGGGGYGGGGHRGAGGAHRGGGGGGASDDFSDNGDEESGAGRYGLLEIPEPVASADADFNRGVSAEEFRQAAIARFQLLDINHTGRLTLAQLEDIRHAAASAARRPPPRKSDDDDQSSGDEQPQM
jgi:Ca2+-binding EF-hand superfamily protein